MWLRDYLKADLPQCRTMLWDYDSKLSNPAEHTILDYCNQFFEDLDNIRPPQVRSEQ